MPPKAYPILAPPSPVIPTEINDDHDVLCVMDMLDTLDSIPGELTQRFGDLRELDAVLNATTVHLTSRLEALTRILESACMQPPATSTHSAEHHASSSSLPKPPVIADATLTEEPISLEDTNKGDEPTTSTSDQPMNGDTTAAQSTPIANTTTNDQTEVPSAEPATTAPVPTTATATTQPDPPSDPISSTEQPWDRFEILLDIAEGISRFKVGVEDKVKVAGNACDHVIQHQSHISSLLSNSTLLLPSLPNSSHYQSTNNGLLPSQHHNLANHSTSTGGTNNKRHRNSPMPSRYANLVSSTQSGNGVPGVGMGYNPSASGGGNGGGAGGGAGGNNPAQQGYAYGPGSAYPSGSAHQPGSETPSKKRRKTGGNGASKEGGKKNGAAAAAGAGAGGEEDWNDYGKGGPGYAGAAGEKKGNGAGGKRWDGYAGPNRAATNPFNPDPQRPYDFAGSEYQMDPGSRAAGGVGTSGAGGKQRGSPSVSGSVRGGSVMPIHSGMDGSGLGATAGATKAGGAKASKSKSSSSKKAATTGEGASKSASSTTGTAPSAGGRKGGSGGGKSGTGSNKTTNSGNASVAGAGDEVGYDFYPASESVRPNQASSRSKPSGGSGSNKPSAAAAAAAAAAMEDVEMDVEADADAEADTTLYCFCQKQSFGEMIGCDDDACRYEWFHLSCLRLDKPPEGTWLCPDCVMRAEFNKKKRGGAGGGSKGGSGGRKGK